MIKTIDILIHQPIHFERGKNYCVEAASGIGKSSLLHFIGGFRTDYEGAITLDGRNIRTFSADEKSALYRTEIAYMFQDLRLFPNLTGYENVQIVNQQTHFRKKDEIRDLFEQLGLTEKWNQQARYLSWGQQQRVAFIRALCQPCSFLFLDEPVSHLDDANGRIMANILKKDQAERKYGIVATSLGKTLPIHYDQHIQL
ncbi:MAG: ATP-binding cassette domain-containing protein [Paludibacteraceae bacterium]|nr:ATP-binding cassette domain-containing protein [Paludibacteraceae bacterium]